MIRPIELEARSDGLEVVDEPARDHDVRLLAVVATPFRALRTAARDAGLDVVPVSGFRDVARQTAIWNRKMARAREAGLDDAAAVAQVLEYSAPPGWSRHHWGTDVDVVAAELAADARLEPADWETGGICAATGRWLARHAADFGFVRPYDADRGGFKPEAWHWSFAPTAVARLGELHTLDWRSWLATEPFDGAALIRADLEALYRRFVRDVAPALRVAGER